MSDREMDPQVVASQIGVANILAISGGRAALAVPQDGSRYPDIILPVGHGYRVRIALDAMDTYVVTREMLRAGKLTVKGVQDNVYMDELGDVAYYASCYKNVDFGEHKAAW